MEDRGYVNPFDEVRDKVAAFKARAREINKKDEELRERGSRRAADEALDGEPRTSLQRSPSQ
jgi:hypothetical protein